MYSYRFEWDKNKALSNLKKHQISFETATHVFKDPNILLKQDRFEHGEERWQAIGNVAGHRILLVAHTYRFQQGTEVIRIISARKANAKEKKEYDNR
ncbi:hypothetical protein A4G20_07600 [Pasteurellaceae bacterium RH1A]|nr:hypothetical protein A4G20_07600 [Pasteurellaceae bacterium RH1A]